MCPVLGDAYIFLPVLGDAKKRHLVLGGTPTKSAFPVLGNAKIFPSSGELIVAAFCFWLAALLGGIPPRESGADYRRPLVGPAIVAGESRVCDHTCDSVRGRNP